MENPFFFSTDAKKLFLAENKKVDCRIWDNCWTKPPRKNTNRGYRKYTNARNGTKVKQENRKNKKGYTTSTTTERIKLDFEDKRKNFLKNGGLKMARKINTNQKGTYYKYNGRKEYEHNKGKTMKTLDEGDYTEKHIQSKNSENSGINLFFKQNMKFY